MSQLDGIETIAIAALISKNKGNFVLHKSSFEKINNFLNEKLKKEKAEKLTELLNKDKELKNKINKISSSGEFFKSEDILPLFKKALNKDISNQFITDFMAELNALILNEKELYDEIEKLYVQILVKNEKWDTLKNYLHNMLDFFEDEEDKYNLAKTHNNIGDIYQAKGEWNQAIGNYSKALEYYEHLGDTSGMAHCWGSLGIAQQSKDKPDEAIVSYQKSLEIFDQTDDFHGKAMTLNNLGLVYQDKQELDKAKEYFTQSWEIFAEEGDIQGMAQSRGNLSMLALAKGDHYIALKQFFEILFLYIKIEAAEQVKQASGIIRYITNQMESNKVSETFNRIQNELSKDGINWGTHVILSNADVKEIFNNLNQVQSK